MRSGEKTPSGKGGTRSPSSAVTGQETAAGQKTGAGQGTDAGQGMGVKLETARTLPRDLPRDLPEFHLRWGEFRAPAQAVADRAELTPEEREVIVWLIRLADRVGPRDLI